MSVNYRNIPPVGQFDRMACWAACLAWWLKAVGDGRPQWNQTQVIAQFTANCDDDGGFPPVRFRDVVNRDGRLRMSAGFFPTSRMRDRIPISDTPVIIGYNYPVVGGTHMNVIFGQADGQVWCMEPFHPYPGSDGQRTGLMTQRPISHFTGGSPNVLLGWASVPLDS
jgi:hypothetical protein